MSSELGTYVVAPSLDELFTDDTVQWVHTYTEDQLTDVPEQLARASSIVTPLSYTLEIEGASDIAPTGEQVRMTYEVAPPSVRAFRVAETSDQGALNILHTTRPGSLNELRDVVEAARDYPAPPGDVRATPSGLAVVGVGLLENIEWAGPRSPTWPSAWRSIPDPAPPQPVCGVLPLVPLPIATGTSSIVAYLLRWLSPMTAVAGRSSSRRAPSSRR